MGDSYSNIVIREYTPRDAKGIAELFNESEEGWPGGFTGGVKLTEDQVREWIKRQKTISILLAELEEKIVGYLSLVEHWVSSDACYVSLFNVHPSYRGRGIGTRLMKRAIWKAYELGLNRVDLHTWAGNLRALKLYKRLGFKWVPGTSVYMQNYLPGLLRLKPFSALVAQNRELLFGFKKSIEPREDDIKVNNHGVYIYEWSIGGESIRAIIDRESWGLCGIDCSDYLLELYPEEERIIRGVPFYTTGRILNRSARELRISLSTTPSSGVELLSLNPRRLILKRGEEALVKIESRVQPNVKDIPSDEPSRHIVVSAKIGDETLVLKTGFKDARPLEINYIFPQSIPYKYRGVINVGVSNISKRKLKVVFDPSYRGELLLKTPQIELEPESREIVSLVAGKTVAVDGLGVSLPYSIIAGNKRYGGYILRVNIPVVTPGRVTWVEDREKDRIIVCSPKYLAEVNLRGARILLENEVGEEYIYLFSEGLGPPFWPNELTRKVFKHRVYGENGAVIIELESPIDKLGGLIFKKTITFRAGSPHIQIDYTLTNPTDSTIDIKLSISGWIPVLFSRRIIVPVKDGVAEIDVVPGETFTTKRDGPYKPEELAEGWCVHENIRKQTVSFMWPLENLSELNFSWSRPPDLQYRVTIPARKTVHVGPLVIELDARDWREVRRKYRYWYLGLPTTRSLENTGGLDLYTKPRLPVMKPGVEEKIRVILAKRRRKVLKGQLVFPDPKVVEPKEIKLNVEECCTEEFDIKVKVPNELGVWWIPYVIRSNYGVLEGKLAIAAICGDNRVNVEMSNGSAIVDNGYMSFSVSTSYAATLYSIKIGGIENIYSPYPEVGTLEWFNPWYGGIRPRLILGGSDNLWREKWFLSKASRGEWTGVSVSTTVRDEKNIDYRSLRITQIYMTLPGSNVIYLRTILENTGRGLIDPRYSYLAFLKPGGKVAKGFEVDRGGRIYRWYYVEGDVSEPFMATEEGYAAILGGSYSAILVAKKPETGSIHVGVISVGPKNGCHLFFEYTDPKVPLYPGEKRVLESYLAFVKDSSMLNNYLSLKNLEI